MVDAILGAVVEKSITLIQNEFATLSGLRKKAEKLETTLRKIRAVLEDAEERQLMDRGVKVWLQELRDAAHVLDDILDDCSSESFKPTNIMFRYQVGHKLNEMMERLDQIAKDKDKYRLTKSVRGRPTEVAEWRQTSYTASPQVYGRDEDKDKVLQFLLSPTQSSDSLSVYAIVGFGGIGKTTLAQLVYNDERVNNRFDLKIWVCVSENFTRTGILCSIIKSLEGKCDVSDLGVMEQIVKEMLRSKRYLLVLDDLWKRNQELEFGLSQHKWNQLKVVLSFGSNGSSVLVSTRDMDVATIMGACQTHHLSRLSEDDCWSLFKEHAFGIDREERPELVKIGKEIVKKCGGSPLAAQALGGVMLLRNEEEEWREVLQSELWTLSDENVIFPALRLSYLHLTPTQKQCFAFCAIFPKDEEIRKQDLIYLWMANGFISSQNNFAAEEVGKMVWNELYRKSFFQDVRIDDLGDDASFKMHDLVHDLAQSIMEKECIYLHEINSIDLSRNTHHIGFRNSSQKPFNKKAFEKVESLRTLYQLDLSNKTSFEWFPTCLRVLRTNSLKSSLLRSLTHLRFLEVYGLNIETLPSSIYNLRKLKILKLKNLCNLQSLPKHLTRLKNLRHLAIEYCGELESFPEQGMEGLHSLRSLEIRWCTKLRCLPDGMRHLTSLEALTIDECDELEFFPEQGMEGLRSLRSLFIRTCRGLRCLPDGIRHLTSLEALTIYGCDKLESFPEQDTMSGDKEFRPSLDMKAMRKIRQAGKRKGGESLPTPSADVQTSAPLGMDSPATKKARSQQTTPPSPTIFPNSAAGVSSTLNSPTQSDASDKAWWELLQNFEGESSSEITSLFDVRFPTSQVARKCCIFPADQATANKVGPINSIKMMEAYAFRNIFFLTALRSYISAKNREIQEKSATIQARNTLISHQIDLLKNLEADVARLQTFADKATEAEKKAEEARLKMLEAEKKAEEARLKMVGAESFKLQLEEELAQSKKVSEEKIEMVKSSYEEEAMNLKVEISYQHAQGFQFALDQVKILYPDLDLHEVGVDKEIKDGQIVDVSDDD